MCESRQARLVAVLALAFVSVQCVAFVFGLKYAVRAVDYAHNVYGVNTVLEQQVKDARAAAASAQKALGLIQQAAMTDLQFRATLESHNFFLVPQEPLQQVDKKVEQPKQIQAKGK